MAFKTYIYKTVDAGQQRLAADVHYPTIKPTKPLPIALLIHGGGFTAGSKDDIPQHQVETLRELGFVVVSVNYRLCPTISIFDGPVSDCKDCYAWCKTTLPQLLKDDTNVLIDPHRVVTLGYSAGGLLALLMATNPEPPLAILDFYGGKYISDTFWHEKNKDIPQMEIPQRSIDMIRSELPAPSELGIHQAALTGGAAPIDFLNPRVQWLFATMANGTLMRESVQDGNYARVDPATYFSEEFPPTFIIHGTQDRAVPVRFSEQAYNELRGLGVEAFLRTVEGADHAFDEQLTTSDPNFAPVKEGLEFLARHAQAGV